MADTILTPGTDEEEEETTTTTSETYLLKDNYLSEFESDAEKEVARTNLDVYSTSEVFTLDEVNALIAAGTNDAINTHLLADDPHGTLSQVEVLLDDYVKTDGSTAFTAPQYGVDPTADLHLTTKRYVANLLAAHLADTDPHNVMSLVEEALLEYAKVSDTYTTDDVYTKSEVDDAISEFVRRDGSTSFTAAQSGVTPTKDAHLTTKRYVDALLYNHEIAVDPHGFITILNNKLANYYKKSEVYSKAQSYSRTLIDQIINSLVYEAAQSAIEEHINQYDPHGTLTEIYSKHYVLRDGSIPFIATQKGVAGEEDDDLVVVSLISDLKEELETSIENCLPIWVTSGPVLTTVGFVEDDSEVPDTITFQEIMDAIFYGKSVDVSASSTAIVGTTTDITMYLHGSALIDYAELYQGDTLIGTYTSDDFTNGQLTVESNAITEDTTFTFIVYYTNGTTLTATCTVEAAFGIFIGLLPKWYNGANITYEYLLELINEDSVNNVMYSEGSSVSSITHTYDFSGILCHPFIALPASYPDLSEIVTPSQSFSVDAFELITEIPLAVDGVDEEVIYKIYIYEEALITLNIEVTFNFASE